MLVKQLLELASALADQPLPPQAPALAARTKTSSSSSSSSSGQINGSLVQVNINSLGLHPYNVRNMAQAGATGIEELAQSIAAQGILQPLVVVPRPHDYHEQVSGTVEHATAFWVLAGNRRLLAARKAGLRSVPCIIREDLETLEAQRLAMLVENIQREGLNPIEQAVAFRELVQQKMSVAEIARQVGRSYSYVYEHLALLDLPTPLKDRIARRQLSYGAVMLVAREKELPETSRQLVYAELISQGLSVRQTRERVAELLARHRVEQAKIEQALRLDWEESNSSGAGAGKEEEVASSSLPAVPGKIDPRIGREIGIRASRQGQAQAATLIAAHHQAQEQNHDPRVELLAQFSSPSATILAFAFAQDEEGKGKGSNDGEAADGKPHPLMTTPVMPNIELRVIGYAASATCQDCGMHEAQPEVCQSCPMLQLLKRTIETDRVLKQNPLSSVEVGKEG